MSKKAKDDSERAAWLRDKEDTWLKYNPKIKPLRDKLLSIGGDFVVPMREPDLKELLERGRLFSTDGIRLHEMRYKCHVNVARLYHFSFKGEKIATGWGLSDDGLWRQHSWLVTSDGKIVETTVLRLMYYGVELTEEESQFFYVREVVLKKS